MENTDKVKIHTEGTPNPNALKFVSDKDIIQSGTLNFVSKESSAKSPLAQKLFGISCVKEVLIGKNFITVQKSPDVIWDSIYEKLINEISKYLESKKPIVLEEKRLLDGDDKNISDVERKIMDILDNQIRPAVNSDGGDIIFDSYEDGVLKLHLQGSCSHCPSSIMTLKAGIETMLKRQIPELKEVISI